MSWALALLVVVLAAALFARSALVKRIGPAGRDLADDIAGGVAVALAIGGGLTAGAVLL